MGRRGTGVEIRGNAIRIQFSDGGQVVRRTYRRDGKALPPTPENLADARRLAAEVRTRIKAGTFSLPEYFPATGATGQALTVGEQLDTWMAVQRIEPSTAAAYQSAVRFWKAAPCDDEGSRLGDRPLHRLKPAQVLKALTFRPGLNAKTINNYVTVLRRAIDLAVANRAIDDNLVRHVQHRKQQLPFPDPFTRDEVEAVVAHMTSEYPAGVANFVEFKFFTGLRPSEVAALRWSDVELEAQRIHVHRAIVQGLEKATTKTNTAEQPSPGGSHAPAVIDPARLRLRLCRSALWDAVARRACVPPQLLDADADSALPPIPQALQHAAQLRDDDVDGRHDACLLRRATRPLGRHAAEHVRALAGRRAQRAGDATAGGRARQGSSPNLSQERGHRMRPAGPNSPGTKPLARVK